MFQNMDKYLMILLLVVVLVVLMRMNNLMNANLQLTLAIAQKHGIEPPDMNAQNREESQEGSEEGEEEEEEEEEGSEDDGSEKKSEAEELTDDQKKQKIEETMVTLSTKIVKGKALNRKEQEFYAEFFTEMEERLQLVKFIQNSPLQITKPSKRLSEDERDKIYLSFFEDKRPKPLKDIIALYANATGNEPSQGNTHGHLKKLMEKKKLSQFSYKLKGDIKPKIYYGLISWFDGKKMKKENIDNIT